MRMTETRKELIDKYEYLTNNFRITLNDWEEEFLFSVSDQLFADDGFLTDLQIEKLEQVYEKYSD